MFEVAEEGESLKLTFDVERLDITDSTELLKSTTSLIEDKEKDIDIEMSNIQFIDSAILGVFIRLNKVCQEMGLTLRFTKPSHYVYNLFKASDMLAFFTVVK